MDTLTCTLIRHGQTAGNLEKRYIGCRSDEPLSEEQIKALRPVSSVCSKDLVFASPMLRARQTAQLLFPDHPVHIIEKLKETDFGRFEGKNYKELSGDPEYQEWIDSNGTLPFPGGEDPETFRIRSFAGFKQAADEAVRAGCCRIWIVAHGGTVMSVMSRLTGKNYFDFMVNCTEGYETVLAVSDEAYDLLSYDRFCSRHSS